MASRWRSFADQTIRLRMEFIPKTATPKEIRDALKDHYPFGIRRHLPYKHWCAAVTDAICKRWPNYRKPPDWTPRLVLSMPRRIYMHRAIPSGQPDLWGDAVTVYCPCCPKRRYQGSCMICGPLIEQAKRINSQQFMEWLTDAVSQRDPFIFGQIADWLRDRGHDGLVDQLAKIERKACKEESNVATV